MQEKTKRDESFYRTIIESKEWKEWEKHIDKLMEQGRYAETFDYVESMECDLLSPEHWKAFVTFVKNAN